MAIGCWKRFTIATVLDTYLFFRVGTKIKLVDTLILSGHKTPMSIRCWERFTIGTVLATYLIFHVGTKIKLVGGLLGKEATVRLVGVKIGKMWLEANYQSREVRRVKKKHFRLYPSHACHSSRLSQESHKKLNFKTSSFSSSSSSTTTQLGDVKPKSLLLHSLTQAFTHICNFQKKVVWWELSFV